MKLRINIVGYYGWGNFGDELFRCAIEQNTERIWGPGASVRTYLLRFSRLRCSQGVIGKTIRVIEAICGGVFCDVIAFCGGSVLSELTGTQRVRERLFGNRRHFEALGISLGPWPNEDARLATMKWVTSFDRVIVRDRESIRRTGQSLDHSGDLAALYDMPRVSFDDREQYVVVCPSADAQMSAKEFSEIVLELSDFNGMEIRVLALNSGDPGDVELANDVRLILAENGRLVSTCKFETVDQTVGIIARSNAVVSQRLHGLIVGYLTGTPIIALSHHVKIDDFCDEIGLPPENIVRDVTISKNVDAVRRALTGELVARLDAEQYVAQTRDCYFKKM